MFDKNKRSRKYQNIFSNDTFRKTISAALFIIGLAFVFGVGADIAQAVNPSCSSLISPQLNRTIVDFAGSFLRSDKTTTEATWGPVSTTIPIGIYDVTLASYDGYTGRTSTTPQLNESWYVVLKNGGTQVAVSSVVSDLTDGVEDATLVEVVDTNLSVTQNIDSLVLQHSEYAVVPTSGTANSVRPICAAFDLQVQGCTDSLASNYDPLAVVDDGSCTYYQCSDSSDNDGDSWIDEFDPGCHTDGNPLNPSSYDPTDDDENTAPVITLVGNNPETFTAGGTYTDAGATAADDEDGNITPSIVVGGDVITATTTPGIYTITYDVTDSHGVAATQVTRTVNVVSGRSCPLVAQTNRTIVDYSFDGLWGFTNNLRGSYTLPTPLPSGEYNITLVSYDWHTGKPGTQLNEQYYLGLENGTTTISNTSVISDLPDADDWLIELVDSSYVISQDVASVTAYHVQYPGNATGSIYPVCAAFDLQIPAPQCSDGIDNDSSPADGLVDIDDAACHTDGDPTNLSTYDPTINDENSAPIITLLGNSPEDVVVGTVYTDAHATASDEEDGDITASIVVGGDTIATSTPIGTYTITYDVTDSDGVAAVQVVRGVNVVPASVPGCTDPGAVNYNPLATVDDGSCVYVNPIPGCTDSNANNYNPSATVNDGSCTYSVCTVNCGGGLTIKLQITDEKVERVATGTVAVTWKTNLQATSQVFYDVVSRSTSTLPFVEYSMNTPKDGGYRYEHSMTITGIEHGVTYYFRPMSTRTNEDAGGKELDIMLLPIIPKPPVCEEYLLEYIQLGADNNPDEVTKLQLFLRDFEGFTDLPVTGIYDQVTYDAVSEFQIRYGDDVLTPWTHDSATGYVYITTKKKINEIYCQREFPLSPEQEAEIEEFKELLASLQVRQEAGEDVIEEIEEATGQIGQIEEETILALLEEGRQEGEETPEGETNEGAETEPTFGEIAAALAPIISDLELPKNTSSEESNEEAGDEQGLLQVASAFAARNEKVLYGISVIVLVLMLVYGRKIALSKQSNS